MVRERIQKHQMLPFIREGDFAVRKPWVSPERRLLDYLIVYVQKGHCLFRVDGQTYRLTNGDISFIQPGSIVHLEGVTDTMTPFIHFDLFYNARREESFPTRPGQIDLTEYRHLMQPRLEEVLNVHVPLHFRPEKPEMFQEHMLRMVTCWLEGTSLSLLRAQHLVMELMMMILDQYWKEEREIPINREPLHWVYSFLSLRLNEPLSIAVMAKRAHLSPSRFRAVFKRDFGVSPHQYIMKLRINHAKELLANTSLSLAAIAEYCGYADMQHFSKTFKLKTNITPGLFREQSRERQMDNIQAE